MNIQTFFGLIFSFFYIFNVFGKNCPIVEPYANTCTECVATVGKNDTHASFITAKKNPYAGKRIFIAWSKGGGAHESMYRALDCYLKEQCSVTAFNPIQDVLHSLDPVRTFTFQRYNGEDVYNYLLVRNMPRVINTFVSWGIGSMRRQHPMMVRLLREYFKSQKPELVISVVPVLNSALAEACELEKIPFLLIAPDLNITSYFIKDTKKSWQHVYCTLPFNDDLGWHSIRQAGVNPHLFVAAGFPLKESFFAPKDLKSIRKDFNVPDNKPVVMMLMGGAGSLKLISYIKYIARLPLPLHLIICMGRGKSVRLQAKIKALRLPSHITFSAIGFTDRIADLMAVSDVLISKTGPTSLCEAIQMRLPLILDCTSCLLDWEKLHPEFVKKHDLGIVLTSFKHLEKALHKTIFDKEYRKRVKSNMERYSNDKFYEMLDELLAHIFRQHTPCTC